MSGPITIAKVEMDGQSWHIYRRGEGGPYAIAIQCHAQRAYIDVEVSPALLRVIGNAIVGQVLLPAPVRRT